MSRSERGLRDAAILWSGPGLHQTSDGRRHSRQRAPDRREDLVILPAAAERVVQEHELLGCICWAKTYCCSIANSCRCASMTLSKSVNPRSNRSVASVTARRAAVNASADGASDFAAPRKRRSQYRRREPRSARFACRRRIFRGYDSRPSRQPHQADRNQGSAGESGSDRPDRADPERRDAGLVSCRRRQRHCGKRSAVATPICAVALAS